MNIRKIVKNKKYALKLPEDAGIYIFFSNNKPLYIGKALSLKARVSSYFSKSLIGKTYDMFELSDSIGYIRVNSEIEALLLEARLIKKYKPKYNFALKDDKRPLYIKITNEEFPIVQTARKIEVDDNSKFYGPFPASANVKHVLSILRNMFHFSTHKPRKGRKCFYSQIGLCNPCPSEIINESDPKIRSELKRKYKDNVRFINGILSGRFIFVRKNLIKKMNYYARIQKFENANDIKRTIEKLDYVTSGKKIKEYLKNPNFLEDVRKTEIVGLKEILGNYMKISRLKRIECFDVAHFVGVNATASMVTFIDGDPEKRYYRHFRIRQKKATNDLASLEEVLKRRINHFDSWGKSDLCLVDGGKAQVRVFFNILSKYDIPVVGLAKRHETLVIPKEVMGKVVYKQLVLSGDVKNLLVRIRDESHRFARRYHHKLLKKLFKNN